MPGKLVTFLLLIFVVSCSKEELTSQHEQKITKDDISINMTSSSDTLRSSDLLELSFEIRFPRDTGIELPGENADFGDFSLYQIDQGAQVAISQSINRLNYVIILEPGLPEKHNLPSLSFKFHQSNGQKIILSTKESKFDVTSVLQNSDRHMADIIITENEQNYWLPAIGLILILIPIFYLASIKRTTLLTAEEELESTYQRFCELRDNAPSEIIHKLPETICLFLKQKFLRPDLPDNFDVVIRELKGRMPDNHTKILEESISKYEEIRFSSEDNNSLAVLVWKDFDSILQIMRGDTA